MRTHREVMETESSKCIVVAVSDYSEAEKNRARARFGGCTSHRAVQGRHSSTARVAAAVAGRVYVGAVRFGGHPGMNCESPDTKFG